MQSEGAGAGTEAVAGHSEDLAKIFDKGDFTKQHIFNVYEEAGGGGFSRCRVQLFMTP